MTLTDLSDLRDRVLDLKNLYPGISLHWISDNVLGITTSVLTRYLNGTAHCPERTYVRIKAFVDTAELIINDSDYWDEDGFNYDGMKAIQKAQRDAIEELEQSKATPNPVSFIPPKPLPSNFGLDVVKKN